MGKVINGKYWLAMMASAIFSMTLVLQANAADRPNLLIMVEDIDEDTVPRNSQVHNRVMSALSNQLHNAGFDVFDETAVTLGDFAQGRVRRSDAELIDIAKSIRRPPMDVVVLFTIYASAIETSYTTKVRARLQGRMLNVQTGQRLGNIELDYPEGWNAPVNCNRDCILNSVGNHIKVIANDVGLVLAQKLSWMLNSNEQDIQAGVMAYNLIFDGFNQQEVMEIEEYLVVFSGYESHRIVYSGATRTEYWYKSDIGSAKLNRNLNKVLEKLEMNCIVQISSNNYTVKKIGRRSKALAIDPRQW